MVDMVDMVDNQKSTKAVSLAAEGSNVNLPGDGGSNGNLRYDEDGCPMLPVGLGGPEPLVQPILLPILDLRTRVERGLDSVNLFDQSPVAASICWIAPLYPDHWDL